MKPKYRYLLFSLLLILTTACAYLIININSNKNRLIKVWDVVFNERANNYCNPFVLSKDGKRIIFATSENKYANVSNINLLDDKGNILWCRRIPVAFGLGAFGIDNDVTAAGLSIEPGKSHQVLILYHFNSKGDLLQSAKYQLPSQYWLKGIIQLNSETSIIVLCDTGLITKHQIKIISVNISNKMLSMKSLTKESDSVDVSNPILLNDELYVIVGGPLISGGESGLYLQKLNKDMDILAENKLEINMASALHLSYYKDNLIYIGRYYDARSLYHVISTSGKVVSSVMGENTRSSRIDVRHPPFSHYRVVDSYFDYRSTVLGYNSEGRIVSKLQYNTENVDCTYYSWDEKSKSLYLYSSGANDLCNKKGGSYIVKLQEKQKN